MERSFTVEFLPFGRTIEVTSKKRIFDIALASGFEIRSECHGQGTCGRCMVRLIRCYTAPTENEGHLFSNGKLKKGFRLACQARVESNLKILLPEESLNL